MEHLEFEPINDAHAIVETVVFIQFSNDFTDQVVHKLMVLSETLRAFFSESSEVKEVAFSTINPQEAPKASPEKVIGVQLRSTGEDGAVTWVLRVAKNSISVHCLDYERWDSVWSRSLESLGEVMKCVDDNTIEAIGLKCIDRFVASKNDNLDFAQLFKSDTSRLPSSVFRSGDFWHNHSGWFDNAINAETPCLNELNISSGAVDIKGRLEKVVTIDHGLTIRKSEAKIDLPSFSENPESRFINTILGLHHMNKNIIGQLLTDKMARRVRLIG